MAQKDSYFKENCMIKGFEDYDLDENKKFYYPDKVLCDEKAIVFLESSATGDRKVHIGEFISFITYITRFPINKEIYFILFLCGKSGTAPNVKDETARIQYYYDNYAISKVNRDKIKGIYVLNQEMVDIRMLSIDEIQSFKGIEL